MQGSMPPSLRDTRPQCGRTQASCAPRSRSRRAAQPHRSRRGAECRAFFGNLKLGGGGGAAASGLAEKPAYSKREMLKIGDLDVSPMGLGTWSW